MYLFFSFSLDKKTFVNSLSLTLKFKYKYILKRTHHIYLLLILLKKINILCNQIKFYDIYFYWTLLFL